MKEWLLVVWLGTTTNFSVLEYHWSFQQCERQREVRAAQISPPFVLVCTQDMREGRSQLPPRSGSSGLVK